MATKKELEKRIKQLTDLGFTVNADTYANGAYVILSENINSFSLKQWDDEIKKYEESKIPFVEAEHIEQPATSTEVLAPSMTVEQVTAMEVKKLDVNKQKIAALKKQYAKISIVDVNDKDGLKKAKEAKATLRGMRTGVEGKRKEIKDFYLTVGKGIDAQAKEYTTLIVDIEDNIDKMLDQYDQWKKDEDERKEKEAQLVLDGRIVSLKDAGMIFNGSYYVIGENISMGIDVIKTMKDAEFDFLLAKVQLEKKKIDEETARQLRITERNNSCAMLGMFSDSGHYKYPATDIAIYSESINNTDEETWQGIIDGVAADIDKYKKEQEDAKNLLKKQQDEQAETARKLQQEKDDFRLQVLQMREQMAINAGLIFNPSTMAYEFSNKYTTQAITKDSMGAMETADFSKFVQDAAGIIVTAKANANADAIKEQQRQNTINARAGLMIQIGMKPTGDAIHGYEYKNSGIAPAADWRDMTDAGWETQSNDLIEKIKTWEQQQTDKEEKQARIKMRNAQCANIGMFAQANGYIYPLNEPNTITISNETINDGDDELWDKSTKEVVEFIADHKRAAQELAEKRQQEYDNRCNALITLGMGKEGVFYFYRDAHVEKPYTVNSRAIAASTDDEWASIYQLAVDGVALVKQSGDNHRKQIEQERQQAIPDIEKANTYLNDLLALEMPNVETPVIKTILINFSKELKNLVEQNIIKQ